MYNVTAEYTAAIRALSKTDRLTGSIRYRNGDTASLADVLLRGGEVSISKRCVTGEELEFGAAIIGELDLSIKTDQARYSFDGAKISPVYGVLAADGTWHDVPLGVYTVCETDRRNSIVKLIAYDNLLSLDKEYDGVAIYGTPFEVLSEICELCGVELANTEDEIIAMPNGDQAIQIDQDAGCETLRDCAKVVAQLLGAFVVADAQGRIALRNYGTSPVARLERKNRVSTTLADYVCRYVGLTVQSSKGRFSAYDTSADSGLELTIQDAPAWDYGTDDTLQQRTDNLLEYFAKIRYTPSNLSIFGDPALECGDMVTLETTDGDVNTLITGYTWKFRGKMSVESIGKNPYLHAVKPKKTQIIRELQQQTTANKLIFYSFSNGSDVVAEGTEVKPLASVTFVTVEDTSAMFLAQLPVVAAAEDVVTTRETEKAVTAYDASGNPYSLTLTLTDTDTKPGTVDLEIFYYMNGSQVDYRLVQSLTAGSHILSLFYPFSELKGNTSQKFEVRILATGGSVTVAKRAFRATVTGQGLSATTVWDGTLTIEEVVPAFSIKSRMALAAFTESVTTATQKPIPTGITEVVSGFSIRSRMTLAGFTEEIGVNPVWEKQSITAARLSHWTYADRYVEHGENGVQLRTSWTYQSAEQPIDEGRMTAVRAVTADLASVEEVTVSG